MRGGAAARLVVAGGAASVAALPLTWRLSGRRSRPSRWTVVNTALQGAGVTAISVWLSAASGGSRLSRPAGDLKHGVGTGACLAVGLAVGDQVLFAKSRASLAAAPRPPTALQYALAIPYAALVEEAVSRLGVQEPVERLASSAGLGVQVAEALGVAASALVFAAGHLPATAGRLPLSPELVARVLALNGAGGVVFARLYRQRSFRAVVIAHAAADTMLLGEAGGRRAVAALSRRAAEKGVWRRRDLGSIGRERWPSN